MIGHSTSVGFFDAVAKDDSENDDDDLSPRSYIKCFKIAARNITNEKENIAWPGAIEQVKSTQNPSKHRQLLTEKRIPVGGGNCEQKTSQRAVAASKLQVNPTSNRAGAASIQQVIGPQPPLYVQNSKNYFTVKTLSERLFVHG